MSNPTAPNPDQVLATMSQKMGEPLPAWPQPLRDLAPDLLVATAMNSAGTLDAATPLLTDFGGTSTPGEQAR